MNDLQDNQGQGVLYVSGTRGYSAYEVAVQNGFVGTEQEWLDSLVGPQGEPGTPFDELTEEQKAEIRGEEGKSAYDIAVENGFIGTEQDWVNSYLNSDNYYNKESIDEKNNEKENIHNSLIFMPVAYYENDDASGDCTVLLANKSKKVVMFDTGATHSYSLIKEKLQENNIKNIDYFILSHFHGDHFWNYTSLIADGYFNRNTTFYLPKLPNSENVTNISSGVDEFKNAIAGLGAEVIYPDDTTVLNIDNIEISFFNCNDEDIDYYDTNTTDYNNYCMCNYIKCSKTKILMTGDIRDLAQEYLQTRGYISKCDILKTPHHSWDLSCYDDFILASNPEYAVSSLNAWMFQNTQAKYAKVTQILDAIETKNYCCGNGALYVGLGTETFTFYPNAIEMKAAEKDIADSEIRLYVDNTYTGVYCDGTKTNPFKNLKSAIAYARGMNTRKVNISFLTTYISNEEIAIHGSKPLIYLNSCSVKSINIYTSNVYLNGVIITGEVNRALNIDSSKVILKNVTINGNIKGQSDPYNGRGLAVYLSEINANGLDISNKDIAIALHDSSTMYVSELKGENNTYGILCADSCSIGTNNFTMICSSNLHSQSKGKITGSVTNEPGNVVGYLANGDDLNNYEKDIGTYISQTGAITTSLVNAPSGIGYAARLVVSKPLGLHLPLLQQEMISTNFEGSTTETGRWIRTKQNDTSNWTAWRKVD